MKLFVTTADANKVREQLRVRGHIVLDGDLSELLNRMPTLDEDTTAFERALPLLLDVVQQAANLRDQLAELGYPTIQAEATLKAARRAVMEFDN